jgi:hypothetical protein
LPKRIVKLAEVAPQVLANTRHVRALGNEFFTAILRLGSLFTRIVEDLVRDQQTAATFPGLTHNMILKHRAQCLAGLDEFLAQFSRDNVGPFCCRL